MLKNIYGINDSTIKILNIKISIKYKGKYNAFQPNPPNKNFIYLLGLDREDNSSGEITYNGDGKVDINLLTDYLLCELLIFPSLQPFDPFPCCRYQLNRSNFAHTYDISPLNFSKLEKRSIFTIVINKYNSH